MYSVQKQYYDLIINKKNSNSFINTFEKEWNSFLNNFNLPFANGKQLFIGNRLRPILCCWGYLHCLNLNEINNFVDISKIAVSLEAVHKASVIIDDCIDGDIKRRGVDCFHIEYGNDNATFFSVCLLTAAIKNINSIISQETHDISINVQSVSMLCNTIIEMCIGAINEINTKDFERCDKDKINDIISKETVILLKNSFLLGYMSTNKFQNNTYNIFSSIIEDCAYIFQVYNDLEPFCNPDYIIKHKGSLNSDCLRSRKNISIPYLYLLANNLDKKKLIKIIDDEHNFIPLNELIKKYNVIEYIFNDIKNKKNKIYLNIKKIPSESVNYDWAKVFPLFVDDLLKYCESILLGKPIKLYP